MKVRLGFVSNSSSSSFLVDLNKITGLQAAQILNHRELLRNDDSECDAWDVSTCLSGAMIKCFTIIDNFDLHGYIIEHLGVPEDAILNYYHS